MHIRRYTYTLTTNAKYELEILLSGIKLYPIKWIQQKIIDGLFQVLLTIGKS